MFKFALDDLTVEGLRKLADQYGISRSTTSREELLAALKDRMATGTEIVLGEPKRPWYKTASIIISVFALVVSAGGWATVFYTIRKDSDQKERDRNQQWQQIIVYKIIKDGTTKSPYTIGFEDIRQKYVSEAIASNIVNLSKDELQPHELSRILLQLIASNVVYLNLNDQYAVQRSSTNKRAERFFLEEDAKYIILDYLSNNGGKHGSSAELYAALQKLTRLESEEFNTLLNQLMASNTVVFRKGKLWSITSAPAN